MEFSEIFSDIDSINKVKSIFATFKKATFEDFEINFKTSADEFLLKLCSDQSVCAEFFDSYFYQGEPRRLPFKSFSTSDLKQIEFVDKYVQLEKRPFVDRQLKHATKTGKILFNGSIFAINKIIDGKVFLGETTYFDGMETSDVFYEKLVVAFGLSHLTRGQVDKAVIRSLLSNWLDKLTSINKGDFSSYHALGAFSLGVFNRHAKGFSIHTKLASDKKFAGAGYNHVFPSGMLTTNFCDPSDTIGVSDFRLLVAKEYLEEVQNELELEKDSMSRALVEQKIFTILGKKINKEVLNILLSDNKFQFCKIIVDGYRLRPEFIFLLEADGRVEYDLGWEIKSSNWIRFETEENWRDFIAVHVNQYVPPGMATIICAGEKVFGVEF